MFKGNCPALITPFTEDAKNINYDSLKKLIDYQIISNVSAILFLGTTGESSTLSHTEKSEIVKFAVHYVNKRVPVIIGAGSNDTAQAINNSIEFEQLGADALLHITPYYNKCTQVGLIKHFTAIAKSTNLPIILYNVPGRTNINMLPSTVYELSKINNIIGIKEASGNLEQIQEIIRICGPNFSVFSGDDALIQPILSCGGKGVISVLSNIFPSYTNDICNEYFKGNILTSNELQLKALPLIRSLFCEINPIPIKAALNSFGFNAGPTRLPLTAISTSNFSRLLTELQSFNSY